MTPLSLPTGILGTAAMRGKESPKSSVSPVGIMHIEIMKVDDELLIRYIQLHVPPINSSYSI